MTEPVTETGGTVRVQYHCNSEEPLTAAAMDDARQVWMCIEPLSQEDASWLYPILDRAVALDAKIMLYVGGYGWRSDPVALRQLVSRLATHPDSQVFLCAPEENSTTPCFRQSHQAILMVGRQNSSSTDRSVWFKGSGDIMPTYDWLTQVRMGVELEVLNQMPWTKLATEMRIRAYEKEYVRWSQIRALPVQQTKSTLALVSQPQLGEFRSKVSEYLKNLDAQREFLERKNAYRKAKGMLHKMLKTEYASPQAFLVDYGPLVGETGRWRLWKSGSMFRQKTTVAQRYPEFLALLKEIHDHVGDPPGELFHRALTTKNQRGVRGVGVNVITEIMHTYRPDLYPILNDNPLTIVSLFGLARFPGKQSMGHHDYDAFSELMMEIALEFEFEDLGHVDECFNSFYWHVGK